MYGLSEWRILSVKKMLCKSRGNAGADFPQRGALGIQAKRSQKTPVPDTIRINDFE